MNIQIRPETKNDYPEIYNILKLAFRQIDEAELVNQLRKSDAFIPGLSLLAASPNDIAGYILFTKIIIKNDVGHEFKSLALAPMAVRPDLQKKGIGGQLIRHGLLEAKMLGFKSVIVLGHENYYPKFGFIPAEKWNIRAPFEVPANVFMGLELIDSALEGVSGTVHYAKEFGM